MRGDKPRTGAATRHVNGAASGGERPAGGHAAIILTGDSELRAFLSGALEHEFTEVHLAATVEELRDIVARAAFDTFVTDVAPPGGICAAELAREVRASVLFDVNVVIVSHETDLASAIASLQDVDAALLRAPFGRAELFAVLRCARERSRIARENYLLQRQMDLRPISDRVVGESEAIQQLWTTVRRVAPMPASVLITGETGTGKELAARALHDLSGRTGSFVPVNCAAIPAEIIESELFGHVRGAFSGAVQSRQGLFGHADRGTLFLDEIGELPPAMQAKLLRVLEEKRYRPVGGNREIATTARILFATNRDLPAEVAAGRFREDLYYRINVLTLRVPPLRDRKSDIARLARLYLHLHAVEIGQATPELEAADLEAMLRYDWPGNIRELRNVIERSLLLNLPIAQVLGPPAARPAPPPAPETTQASSPAELTEGVSLKTLEESCIAEALRAAGGNKSAAARLLGVSRKTVERRMKRIASMNGRGPHASS